MRSVRGKRENGEAWGLLSEREGATGASSRWALGGSWGEEEVKNWWRGRRGWVAVGAAVREDPDGGDGSGRGAAGGRESSGEEFLRAKATVFTTRERNKALSLSY